MALMSLKTFWCSSVTFRNLSAVLLLISALDQMLILCLGWWEKSRIGQEWVSLHPGQLDVPVRGWRTRWHL